MHLRVVLLAVLRNAVAIFAILRRRRGLGEAGAVTVGAFEAHPVVAAGKDDLASPVACLAGRSVPRVVVAHYLPFPPQSWHLIQRLGFATFGWPLPYSHHPPWPLQVTH